MDGAVIGEQLFRLGHGPEAADHDTLVFTVTVADEPEWVVDFAEMLATLLDNERAERRPPSQSSVWRIEPDVVLTPRDAFLRGRRRVPIREAVGEVSAEQFCPYPPGVPLLAPGERVTKDSLDAIRAASRFCRIAYCSDPSLETMLIVDQ